MLDVLCEVEVQWRQKRKSPSWCLSQFRIFIAGAAGPPKGIAKLLTVSESGRMRSPPLVEKFRRAKETMLQNWQSQPTNGKLLSLERMFHEVS